MPSQAPAADNPAGEDFLVQPTCLDLTGLAETCLAKPWQQIGLKVIGMVPTTMIPTASNDSHNNGSHNNDPKKHCLGSTRKYHEYFCQVKRPAKGLPPHLISQRLLIATAHQLRLRIAELAANTAIRVPYNQSACARVVCAPPIILLVLTPALRSFPKALNDGFACGH